MWLKGVSLLETTAITWWLSFDHTFHHGFLRFGRDPCRKTDEAPYESHPPATPIFTTPTYSSASM